MKATSKDVWDYTHGGCYDLALAVHDLTGWPLVIVQWEYHPWDSMDVAETGCNIPPHHALVESPAGYVDIYTLAGHAPLSEPVPPPYPWEYVDAWVVDNLRWSPVERDRTEALARAIVERVGLDLE